jgi:hypothetical protein
MRLVGFARVSTYGQALEAHVSHMTIRRLWK